MDTAGESKNSIRSPYNSYAAFLLHTDAIR